MKVMFYFDKINPSYILDAEVSRKDGRHMQIKKPQPFTFEEGERAVLLLHGFTGHTADVRMLGRSNRCKCNRMVGRRSSCF